MHFWALLFQKNLDELSEILKELSENDQLDWSVVLEYMWMNYKSDEVAEL